MEEGVVAGATRTTPSILVTTNRTACTGRAVLLRTVPTYTDRRPLLNRATVRPTPESAGTSFLFAHRFQYLLIVLQQIEEFLHLKATTWVPRYY
jgi:hypothetical protein